MNLEKKFDHKVKTNNITIKIFRLNQPDLFLLQAIVYE